MTQTRIPASSASVAELATRLEFSEEACRRAYAEAGLVPTPEDWVRYLSRSLLGLGAALVVAGITAFFASNWADMSHFAKFAWIQVGIATAVSAACWRGFDSVAGSLLLFTAAFLTGVLLAVYGQVYQTGADPYGLFLSWALLILPLAIVGRQQGIWMLFIVLLNLCLIMYWTQVLRPPEGLWMLGQLLGPLVWLGTLITDPELSSATFLLNAVALVSWEYALTRHPGTGASQWFARVVAFFALATVVAPTLLMIFAATVDEKTGLSLISPALLAVAGAACVYYYQVWRQDLFILTCCALAAILVVTALAIKVVALNVGSLFFLALLLMGQVAAAAWWLRQVARRWQSAS